MLNVQEEKFIDKHSAKWEQLKSLSTTITDRGKQNLSSQQIKKFLELFRKSSHHLAYARTHYPNSELIEYLNNLIANCHSQVYAVDEINQTSLTSYLSSYLPQLLKRYKYYILASFGCFALGAIISLGLVLYNPEQAHIFLPEQMVDSIKNTDKTGGPDWNYALMSSKIMVNNITVALKSFVLGITFGLGTIYVLFFNGALLGALTALIYSYGNPLNYWSLILPHGVIELTAIFISGAAGLIIAKHLLLPGQYSRKDSLIAGTKQAVSLLAGVVILLIIAGLIEGFFTPLNISPITKLSFAALTAILLAAYYFLTTTNH